MDAVASVAAPRSFGWVRTVCPLCATCEFDRPVYAANFRVEDLTPEVFSARRTPDRKHYAMVRCGRCGMLRADPILAPAALERLYAESSFTYGDEAGFAEKTYDAQLGRALAHTAARGRLLEIGCGSGFFLEAARRRGFSQVWGVEPSGDAIAHAAESVRSQIRAGLYGESLFPPAHFDVVCGFQVLDHMPDPLSVLRACRAHLKPGGVALFVNHDCGAWSARLLGERSPIVDIEHPVLFDRATMRHIFAKAGFAVREVFAVWNTYPLRYWARLAPLPAGLKAWLGRSPLGRIVLPLPAGNLGVIAVKE